MGIPGGLVATVAVLLLAAAGVAPAAAASAADFRPEGCTRDACPACAPYSVSKEDLSSPIDLAFPCGNDGLYFPVPVKFSADCETWRSTAWKCLPCCSAGCAVGACQFAWSGSYNGTAGCAKCAAGQESQNLGLSRETCRSCDGKDEGCYKDATSAYQVCGDQSPPAGGGDAGGDASNGGSGPAPPPPSEEEGEGPPSTLDPVKPKAPSPSPSPPAEPAEPAEPPPSPELPASPPAEMLPAPEPAPEEAPPAPAPAPEAFPEMAPMPAPAAAPAPAPLPATAPLPAPASAAVPAVPAGASLAGLLAMLAAAAVLLG